MARDQVHDATPMQIGSDTRREFGPGEFLMRRPIWADVLVFTFVAAVVFGIVHIAGSMTGPRRAAVDIDLSPFALPKYVAFSLFRGFAAYFLSLGFSLVYGYLAAKNRRAERLMVPLLDVLQSIPVLGFMPALMLGFATMFPNSNLGMEIVSILLIFTGQVWNMTFSFYHSLKSIPRELTETARIYRFGWWQRFTKVELSYAALPLAWNSMVGMAGGWFFLTICESFQLGEHDFRLPGIGSYMSAAIARNSVPAMIAGILAMTITIVIIDRLFWRPIIAWATKFKYDESPGEEPTPSVVLDLIRASRIAEMLEKLANKLERLRYASRRYIKTVTIANRSAALQIINGILMGVVAIALTVCVVLGVWGAYRLVMLVIQVQGSDWLRIGTGAGLSLLRVVATLILASLWAVPVGILIGKSAKLTSRFQPFIQVVASFPAPMLYPLVLMALHACGVSLQFGSVFLLMLGTQWYILFNAIAGAMSIPQELKETCKVYKIRGTRIWTRLYLPAVLSNLVTGWIAAAGGAWNATIVAEYLTVGGETFTANGLGAIISISAENGDFHTLAASVLVMAIMVVLINRLVWRRIFTIATEKFSLSQ